MQMHHPAHPGDVLRDVTEGMNQSEMALRLGVTRQTLSRILNGHASVTAQMAIRLGEAFPSSPAEFWLKLQMQYDLWHARQAVAQLRSGLRKKVAQRAA